MPFYILKQSICIIVFGFCFVISGMDNVTTRELMIPPVIQEHSQYLAMLKSHNQIDFSKHPLLWTDKSFVTQNELNTYAARYEPNFDYTTLSLDQLLDTIHFHDYFQMKSNKQLKNALYNKFKTHQIKLKEIKKLSLYWQKAFISLFIQDTRLDVRLLKPYSHTLIEDRTKIAGRKDERCAARLLFLNNTQRIYGVYELFKVGTLAESRSIVKLRIEDSQGTIQREIGLLEKHFFKSSPNITIHPNGLYAIVEYTEVVDDYARYSSDIIDFTSTKIRPKIIPLWEASQLPIGASHVYCFGKDKVYVATCDYSEQVILKSIDLNNKQEKKIVVLNDPGKERMFAGAITINEDASCIVVAACRTLFVVKNNGKDVKIIVHNNNEGILKLSLNNKGTLLCVITTKGWIGSERVYLYAFPAHKDYFLIDIPQKLQGSRHLQGQSDMLPRKESRLESVSNVQWSSDDNLLFLKCNYAVKYKNYPYVCSSSKHKYVFYCPATQQCWSKRSPQYCSFLINSGCNGQLIVEHESYRSSKKNVVNWYDKNMKEALSYLNVKQNGLDENKWLGMIILYKIITQPSDSIISLDQDTTTLYKSNVPDAIKLMLPKLLLTENQTLLLLGEKVPPKIIPSVWSLLAKNFLCIYQEAWFCGLSTILFAMVVQLCLNTMYAMLFY